MTTEQLYMDHEKIVYTSINELIKYKRNFCLTKGMTIDDLEQYGRLALWKACLKCEDTTRFPAYAYKVVKGAIKDLIFNHTSIHLVRLPYRNEQAEREAVASYLSVDKPSEETGMTILDNLNSHFSDVESYVIRKLEFEEKLSLMTEKQQRYLLDYLNGYSTTEIAHNNGLSSQYGVSMAILKGVNMIDPNFKMSLRRGRRSVG